MHKIWCNKHILVDKSYLYNTTLANQGINQIGQLLDTNGAMKPWSVFKSKFKYKAVISIGSNKIMPFQNFRMKIFIKETKIFMTLPLADTISLKKYQIYSLSKCSSKELYSLQVSLNDTKTESQIYFAKNFPNKEIDRKCVYLMPCRVTIETNLHVLSIKFWITFWILSSFKIVCSPHLFFFFLIRKKGPYTPF